MNIIHLIEEIYLLLQFVVPGYMFHAVYAFLISKRDGRPFASLGSVKIIATSFIFVTLLRLFDNFFIGNTVSFWIEMGILLFLSSLSPFIVYKIRESRLFKYVLYKTTNKTVNNNLWKEAIDYVYGTQLKMYFKNQETLYIGTLAGHEENGSDSWFQLREYLYRNLKTGEEFNSTKHDVKTTVMIPLSEIERVELFYDNASDALDYWKLSRTKTEPPKKSISDNEALAILHPEIKKPF